MLAASQQRQRGPVGGNDGGYLIFEGTPEQLAKKASSATGKYLKEKLKI
ncbi:MAG TPA: hypothetical protein PKY54_02610 [Chitinophagales bacterium]|nr:hypothetical protein [Chitinophagales bacterium]